MNVLFNKDRGVNVVVVLSVKRVFKVIDGTPPMVQEICSIIITNFRLLFVVGDSLVKIIIVGVVLPPINLIFIISFRANFKDWNLNMVKVIIVIPVGEKVIVGSGVRKRNYFLSIDFVKVVI